MRTRWRSSAICGSARIRISRARGADRHLCAPLSLVGPLALTIEILDRGRRDKQTGEGSMLPHRYYIPALAALAAGLAAVAQAQPPTPAAEQGIASWYGGPFEGQRAASGEIYRPEELTARCPRSEEHTSELQSPCNLVCRLLLEKKKKNKHNTQTNTTHSPVKEHHEH